MYSITPLILSHNPQPSGREKNTLDDELILIKKSVFKNFTKNGYYNMLEGLKNENTTDMFQTSFIKKRLWNREVSYKHVSF